MKKILLSLLVLVPLLEARAQTTLDACQQWAEQNYPLIRDYALIDKTTDYTLSNATRSWLPEATLSAQATYQSDAAAFPDAIRSAYQAMGFNLQGINKDQYRAALDLHQTLWDGGASRAAKRSAEAEGAVHKASTAVSLYAIRGRINALFFGALLSEAQARQNQMRQELLQSTLDRVRAWVANGIAMASDADAVEAELLASQQQRARIDATYNSYIAMLSIFTGRPVGSLTEPPECSIDTLGNNRPELGYFDRLEAQYAAQSHTVRIATRPQIGANIQGFYGNPGLNLFKDMTQNRWTWNYLAGIKIQWRLGAYYTQRNRLQTLDVARQRVALQRETFLFNNRLQVTDNRQAIDRLHREMVNDRRIIALRESVRSAYESKLQNGIIMVNDLLREITAESEARMNEAIHRIELLKNIYDLKFTVNH